MNRTLSLALVLTLWSGMAVAEEDTPAATETASPLQISMFADGYYAYMSNKIGAAHPGHRAYAQNNGFSLSFLGSDIVYDTQYFGATASLRFGPSVPIYYGGDVGFLGIDNIVQAFATLKPSSALSIDFGQFGTIYGAEVAESWQNLNYTRGALYYGFQPFWHTGARMNYSATDELTLRFMVVNGVNNIIEDGKGRPSVGAQAAYATDTFGLAAGYFGSLDPSSDAMFDHFVDVVANLNVEKFSLLFNFDLGMDTKVPGGSDTLFYGFSLAAGYALSDCFGFALRGEYIVDADNAIYQVAGASKVNVITGTLTLDWKPFGVGNVIVRWDNRIESSNQDIFPSRGMGGLEVKDSWFQSVLGVVVTSTP